ncbi:MAG: translocation/assembly module TamB domain-containing protein [Pseudomonadales bacterium]
MKRLLVVLLGALLLALGLVAGAVTFLAQTEGGTRFLAAQAERFLPVRFEDVSGTLWRAVRVGRVTLSVADRVVEIEGLALTLHMMPLLFDNRLELNSAAADVVLIGAVAEDAEQGPPARLELPFMPVDIELGQLDIGRLQLPNGSSVQVSGSASWGERGVTVRTLELNSEGFAVALAGDLGTGSNPSLAAQLRWWLPGTDWAGKADLEGRVNRLQVEHVLKGAVAGRAVGSADLSFPAIPAVDLRVDLDDLEFGATALQSVGGRLAGTLENLEADAAAMVSTGGLEPFQLFVNAYGPAFGPLTLRNVSANALDGAQEAQGSLAWQDGVRLLLGGTATDVYLGALREELNGRASGDFQLRFEQGMVDLALRDLTGTLNDLQIEGELTLAQVTDGWRVAPLRLQVGDNRLEGTLWFEGMELDLDAQVAAPALAAFGPWVQGDATGSVRLSGRWPDVSGRVELESGRLDGFGVTLDQTTLAVQIDDGVVQAEMLTADAQRQQLALQDARLSASGPLNDVDWRLRWAGGESSGALRRQAEAFLLRVDDARMRVLDEDWALTSGTELRLDGDRLQLSPTCIAGGGASACVHALSYAAGEIDTRGRLERAPVALLQPWLPVRLGDQGYLQGGWSLAGTPGDWRGDLMLAALQLAYLPNQDQASIDLPDLEVVGSVVGDALELRLSATGEAFTLTGQGSLAPLALDGALAAVVDAAATDLAPLRVFDQRLETLSGSVNGRVNVAGTLREPRAEGELRVEDGVLVLNEPDFELAELSLQLRLDEAGDFALGGTAKQRRGDVQVSGSGSGLFDGSLRFEAAVVGTNLRVQDPDWDVSLSPDLTMTYADGRGRVRGSVEVPRAEVRLTSLPTSVPSPSDDVVVVGREATASAATSPIQVDVELVLGDDVSLQAIGIRANLAGRLRARLDGQGRTTLRGNLDVAGGVLAAQGQTLTIESGSVVYSGPVARPYIDVRAARTIDDVEPPIKAGLHIRGNADNLTSSVYSEPAMSDTRALSFLVLGRDMDQQTEGTDSGQLLAAAINLGLSRSKNITSDLMRMTGLDELSAMAEAQNSFAIVAGKRITDQLYVRYTYNTLSALGAFMVRYDLDRRWQLEAQSGEQSAMDLMYRIQK